MPGKDDLFANRTLWIDREHMDVARERFFMVWLDSVYRADPDESLPSMAEAIRPRLSVDEARQIWRISWAAAVAAFSFLQEGNLGPPVGKQPESAVDSD